MFGIRISRCLLNGGRKGAVKAPTLTVRVDSGVAKELNQEVTRKASRILRPITEEEENYELTRARRNAGSNLRLKGKQQIQSNRKASQRQLSSLDQI